MNVQTAQQIAQRRNLVDKQPEAIKEKRKSWVRYLTELVIKMPEPNNNLITNNLKIGELYKFTTGKIYKTKFEVRQFDKERKYCNTRLKIISETSFEIDNLHVKKAIKVMGEVCNALMRNRIHFALFMAEGQRSPWIRIYDLDDLTLLNPQQREEAQKQFWKSVVPNLYQYADKSVWMDNHPLQLEFSPHWKWGTTFDLIYEHLPKQAEATQEVLFEVKKKGYFDDCLTSDDIPRLIYEKKKKVGYIDNVVNVKWDFMKLLIKKFKVKNKKDLEKHPNYFYIINRQPNEDEILIEEFISTMPVYLGKRLEVYNAIA